MKRYKNREDRLRLQMSFFLLSGAVLGTLFLNLMDGQMQEELKNVETSLLSAAVLQKIDFKELFVRVLSKRIPQLLFACLVAMTPAAPVLFPLMGAGLGFSSAVMVCALTMDAGLWGIARYLILIFPQAFFYVPAIYLLLLWMPQKQASLKASSALALTVLVLLGAAAESCLNPWAVAAFL